MLETKTKIIGSTEYEVTQLPFLQARKVMLTLTNKLGPGIGQVLAASPNINDINVAVGVEKLSENLDEATLVSITDTFGPTSRVFLEDGRKPYLTKENLNSHFKGGNMLEYFQWLAFCVEVNFSDFFKELALQNLDDKSQEKEAPASSLLS